MAKEEKSRFSPPEEYYDGYDYTEETAEEYGEEETFSGGGRKRRRAGSRVLIGLLVFVLIAGVVLWGGFQMIKGRANYEKADTTPYEDASADVMGKSSVQNILLIGADRSPDGTNGRSDTMVLLSVDRDRKTIRLVSFMRDIYLEIPTVGYERLNAAFANGGAALLMQTIENTFEVEVDRYALVGFDAFRQAIDALGGLDLEIAAYEAEYINAQGAFEAKEGMNHLDGEAALYFARMRKLDSDFGRTGRQRQVILAMIDALKSGSTSSKLRMIYRLLPYITHNLKDRDLLTLAPELLSLSGYSFETLSIPAQGTYEDTVAEIGGTYGNQVLAIDIGENRRIVQDFLYGDG